MYKKSKGSCNGRRKNMKKMPTKKATSVGASSPTRKPAERKQTYGVLKKTTTLKKQKK